MSSSGARPGKKRKSKAKAIRKDVQALENRLKKEAERIVKRGIPSKILELQTLLKTVEGFETLAQVVMTVGDDVPKPKRTPEQEKYLAELHAKAEQRQYDSMIEGVDRREREARDPTNFSGLKHASTQMAMGANVIVAMATMFTVGYWIGKIKEWDTTASLLLGLLFLVLTLIMEVVLLMIYVYKHEMDDNKEVFKEAKAKEKAKAQAVQQKDKKVD